MKVLIKNNKMYPRQVQYYMKNLFRVVNPGDVFVIESIKNDFNEINYYKKLESSGFTVCVHEDDNTCSCEEYDIHHNEEREDTPEVGSKEDESLDLSRFSDDDLKRIVKNLGIETRVRARQKLESLVVENLPRDHKPEDYLN